MQRYGFHGLSYAYIASVLADYDPGLAAGRVVVAHLGSGASLCALKGGVSVATTMGFSALDGLPMGTRCGALDPGVVFYMLRDMDLSPAEAERMLYTKSGLLGVSGLSNDMRLLRSSAGSNAEARQAIDLFVYRIQREIGSLVAALGGLDGLDLHGRDRREGCGDKGRGRRRPCLRRGGPRPRRQCGGRTSDFGRAGTLDVRDPDGRRGDGGTRHAERSRRGTIASRVLSTEGDDEQDEQVRQGRVGG